MMKAEMSNGIDESKVDELLESFEKSKAKKEKEKTKTKREEEGTFEVWVKYFIHGIAFSLLFTVLTVVWIFTSLILVLLGSLLGLIIGIGILMLIIGGLNSLLTSFLWFPVKTSLWSILSHGIVLFILLLIANSIVLVAPSLVFPGIATTVVTLIIGCFIDGFVCKTVARFWEEEREEGIPESVDIEWRSKNL
jgi:F0F1-type ATP synthase assembly protein I